MATKYTFNVNSPFFQGPQPKPEDRTSSNPFGLSFGGGYSDTLTKMNERFNLLISDNLKSLYSFLDDKALDKLNPLNLFKKDSNVEEKKKFNLGKTLLKGASSIGRGIGSAGKTLFKGYGAIGEFIPTKQGAENGTEQVVSSAIDSVGKIVSKTPIGAAWYTTYKLGSLFGLNGTATDFNDKENGLTFVENLGNALTKPIPFIGALGTSVQKNDRSRLAGSHMYSWEGNIDKYGSAENGSNKFNVLFGGPKIAEGGKKDKININAAIGIKDLGNRDILGAADVFKEWQKLNSQIQGGWDYINPDSRIYAKLGSILQFSKRTLSKLKISKHLIGGKIKEMSETIDKVSEKLSLIPLDEYLQQKRQAWIEKAIQKASTRNAPYMFKNKDWKNCIATAFDSYGLYDKNGMPLVIRNADFAADPNKYGFTELQFGDSIDTLPDGVLIQDYNNPKDRSTPGHAIILTGRDENEVPIYSWSSGNNEIEDMHPLARLYSFYWTDKVKPKAYQFIGTPEQISQWVNEYKQMYNLSDDDIKAFKEGGKVNVIPSGALHAHKHNLTEVAEDGEKFEDVTTKGIPVVVEDEKGNLIQQAEVEREEIIFRLEVTKQLEELSKEHTDEAAIEAGKLLTYEILYNTEDKTNNMI